MSKFATRLLVMVVIFGLTYMGLMHIPSLAAFDFQIHGWGWAVLIGTIVASSVVFSFITGFTKGLVGPAVSGNPLAKIAGKTFGYVCFAWVIVAVAGMAPAWIAITSPVGLFWLLGAIGFASSICDEIDARFFPKEDSK